MSRLAQRTDPTAAAEVRASAKAGVLLVVAGGLAGVLNLAFNVEVARRAGVDTYGEFSPLLMLATVAGILATGLQYSIARAVARANRPTREVLGPVCRVTLVWLVVALVGGALAPFLDRYLHLGTPFPVLFAAVLATATVANAAAFGLLTGLRLFRLLAAITIGGALLRLGLGWAAGGFAYPVEGALAASALAALAVVGASYQCVRRVLSPGPGPAQRPTSVRLGVNGLKGAAVAGLLWGVWGVQLLAARHALSTSGAGDYAAYQVVVGGIIWVTAPLVTAFYPTLSRRGQWPAVLIGILGTMVLALVGVALLALAGPHLIQRLYGRPIPVSPGVLLALSLSAGTVAVATFGSWASVARNWLVGPICVLLLFAFLFEVVFDSRTGAHPLLLAQSPGISICLASTLLAALIVVRRVRRTSGSSLPQGAQDPVTIPW